MKNDNIYLIPAVVIAAIGIIYATVYYAKPRESNSVSSEPAVIENETYDFNQISMADGKVSYRAKIKNTGQETLVINKVYTSCMCTEASILGKYGRKGPFGMQWHGAPSKTYFEAAPKEEIEIDINFDPAAHGPSGVGLARRSVYIETNSVKVPVIELKFTALVTN